MIKVSAKLNPARNLTSCVSAAKHNMLIFSWAILMRYVQATHFEVVITRVRWTSLIGSYNQTISRQERWSALIGLPRGEAEEERERGDGCM